MKLIKFALYTCAAFSLSVLPALAGATVNLGIQYGTGIGLGSKDIRETIASIINVAMGLLGIIAVCIILYGGFRWMTAGGDSGKVDEAKKIIVSGIIGLIVILTAYAIAQFVVSSLISAT